MLARGAGDAIGATYVRIDTIELAIVSTLVPYRDNPVGYVVAKRVAADRLVAGRDVVAGAVNGVAARRGPDGRRWRHRPERCCGSRRCDAVTSPNIAAAWRKGSTASQKPSPTR